MDLLRSLPIGLYLEKPITWLHTLDPRVKFVWLMVFLLTPIAASPYWRLSLLGWIFLFILSTRLPLRVWSKQLGLVTVFSLILFCVTVLAPDGITANHQPRLPTDDLVLSLPAPTDPSAEEATDAPSSSTPNTAPTASPKTLPQPTAYRYILAKVWIFQITRRSLDLAVRVGSLVFTFLASTNLYLLTTAPEEITASLERLMRPLRRLRVPVSEIVLTLTLSLRFIPLVLEEIQNLVRSIRTRAINWKKLGFRNSSQVWLTVAERLIDNLLVRAEQTASAMQVRGFTTPNAHRVQWYQFQMRRRDWAVLIAALLFVVARFRWGQMP